MPGTVVAGDKTETDRIVTSGHHGWYLRFAPEIIRIGRSPVMRRAARLQVWMTSEEGTLMVTISDKEIMATSERVV